MYQYALYYYKKAASLRPGDGRMWCAVGNCLCRLGAKAEATRAFERAVAAGDRYAYYV
jgi:anaphase-promoting complex subunit 8